MEWPPFVYTKIILYFCNSILVLLLGLVGLVGLLVRAAPPRKLNVDPSTVRLIGGGNNRPNTTYYNYGFLQTDGTNRQENGRFQEAGEEAVAPVIRGSYSWVAPEGVYYVVNYYADATGFHPTIEQTGPFDPANFSPGQGYGDIPPHVLASLLGG